MNCVSSADNNALLQFTSLRVWLWDVVLIVNTDHQKWKSSFIKLFQRGRVKCFCVHMGVCNISWCNSKHYFKHLVQSLKNTFGTILLIWDVDAYMFMKLFRASTGKLSSYSTLSINHYFHIKIRQATGLDALASRVKCPARFVSHLQEIFIYIWVVYSFCLFCCLFIIVTWWYMWCIVWQVASKRKYRHVW